MIERGEFYLVNNLMVVAHDYERIDGYGRMWSRLPVDKNCLETYCQALKDCGYKDTTEDFENLGTFYGCTWPLGDDTGEVISCD